jgi:hypothetical protein
MTAEVFVDTNVLLYTIDEDPTSASKRQRAQQLLLSENWAWSVQVAAEFFVNATRRNGSSGWRLSMPPLCWKTGLLFQCYRSRPTWFAPQSTSISDFN